MSVRRWGWASMRRVWLAVGLVVVLLVGWLVWARHEPQQPEAWCEILNDRIAETCQPGDWLNPERGTDVLSFCDLSKPPALVHAGVFCRYLGYKRVQRMPTSTTFSMPYVPSSECASLKNLDEEMKCEFERARKGK